MNTGKDAMNTQIYAEAGEWLIEHRAGSLDEAARRRFDAWLRESPQHVRAYLEMSAVWEDTASLDPSWNPSADELIARARADGGVIELPAPARCAGRALPDPKEEISPSQPLARCQRADFSLHMGGEGSHPRQQRTRFLHAIAASILLTCAGAWLYSQRNTYSTDVGEQRSIVLNDGSTIELNSRSRVRVRFSTARRDLYLLEGQALFHVARDSARPFVVHSGSTRVRAVGTQFDVYRKRTGTVVTVVEGRVAVISEPHPQQLSARSEEGQGHLHRAQELLAAGEQLVVTPSNVTPPKRANVAAATAWTRRSLVFESAPLTEVADEFNRYNTRQLIIQSTQLADFHVSGVFSSVDPALLLTFLRTQPELVVEETQRSISISKR